MRYSVIACLAGLAAVVATVPASAAQHEFSIAAAPVLEDHMPNPPVVFDNGVRAWRDVTYQTLDGYRPQILDIYVPPSKGPHPLVLYIHGGGWRGGHTRHSGAFADFPAALAAFASEGFTIASLEYRLSSEARFPAQLQDANAAIRFLRAHARQYKIDPAKVGLWGGSAGGHLAALTALTCRNTTLDPAAGQDECVQAAVTWYGVFDFAAMNTGADGNAAGSKLLGCTGPCSIDALLSASPEAYIDAKDPPFLLIHGTEDKVVPVSQSRKGEAAFRRAGVPVESIYVDGVDHSFIGKTPEQTRAASLRAINATIDFFHDKLGVPRQ